MILSVVDYLLVPVFLVFTVNMILLELNKKKTQNKKLFEKFGASKFLYQ